MALAVALVTACGGDLVLPGSGGPIGIRVVNGDGQLGQVGEPLTTPVTVEVTDANGQPVEGATVEFELTSAGEGGEISPPSSITNAAGRAEAHLLLGDKVGLQTGEARVVVDAARPPTATFSALANAPNPDNHPPVSDFNWHCEGLSCQFTDASGDDDGGVTGWHWQFGDGGTSDQSEPAHVYPGSGTYAVTLRVTDNDGAIDEALAHVDVSGSSPPPESNKSPHAEFEVHCEELTCTFTDKSSDDDGSLVNWVWDFGDGSGSGVQSPVHSYETEGRYEVTLTVTDNLGATDSKDHHAEAED